MKKVYWACKHICMLNWFDSFWLTSSTHSWINLSCFLILGIRHSSSDKSLQRFQEAHFRYSRKKGAVFLGKSKFGFPNPKSDFAFLGANPKTDHESIKSTPWRDSSDQIHIRKFEIHNLGVFFRTKMAHNSCRLFNYIRILFLNPFSATFFACM